MLRGSFMGMPTAIAEQNAILGITNRILGNFADKIFVTYAQTKDMVSSGRKVILSGNPVRAAFVVECVKKKKKKNIGNCLFSADRREQRQSIETSSI